MPPFTFVTASGLVKLIGSDPPGQPGRNNGLNTVTLGSFFLCFFSLFTLQNSEKGV